MSHRLFIGIRPPAAIRDALIDLMEGVDGARWQDEDQLHLTLRFIGEVDSHQADELAGRLHAANCPSPELTVRGVGTFAKKGRAHTLWAGIENSPELQRLQRRVERYCVNAGLEPERRKYHPHITLARLNRSTGPLDPFLLRHQGLRLGPWQVEDYILYEAFLRPEGSFYEPVVRYPLEPWP
ncbi:RNA 2',3'-cyclic phosphodiesterase [Erythrobacter sp. AP23]|uniref:RNA 2',3'-cyclic phosphodiesterase n=1 Tax=Erythrobacter sp. AP23 TaxID=499656 RepID=UPI00076C740F|nr:RNA 2',3'-cyclic phosphodiesterase [Erythrobacter sp. AP23]KWV96345.1 2'-5' RNA ligase [Erythrobacter sp. AP23]